ncbi:MAG: hypothetical protein ACLQOO_33650 [Terriglobia bacterium]
MAKISYRKKFEKLDAEHPGLLQTLEAALDERKHLSWIGQKIATDHRVSVKLEDIEGYMGEKWGDDPMFDLPEVGDSPLGSGRKPPKRAGAKDAREHAAEAGVAQPRATRLPVGQSGVDRRAILNAIDEASLVAFKEKAAMLLEEAVKNPNSDASEIVRIAVQNSMMRDSAKFEEVDVMKRYESEAKYRESEAKLQQSRSAQYKAETARMQAQKELVKAQRELVETRQKAGIELRKAQRRVAQGKEPNTEEMIRKVSAAIGISGPLIPRVEKEAQPGM